MCTHFQVIIMQISIQQMLLHKQLFISLMLIELSGERSILHTLITIMVETPKARPLSYNLTAPETGFSYVATVTHHL